MFYETRNAVAAPAAQGLGRDPFKALVVPRPIGWITSLSPSGVVNLAPFSFFNAISEDPPMVMFCPGGRKADRPVKDSRANVEATKEFVCNLATWDTREAMNQTSATLPAETDEMAFAGLTPAPSRLIKPPRVAEVPVHLECRYWKTIELPTGDPAEPNCMILGEVIGVHIDDSLVREGRVAITAAKPIARLGYSEYCVVTEAFRMRRPG
jgi:flavin reductase (DIM6/NTAB) family NADH-FMN oxidoreductase RutF